MFLNGEHYKAWDQLMRLADTKPIAIPCTNYPDAFTPERGESTAEAKSLCKECPIMVQCAEYGIMFERTGIYGGLAAADRRHVRAARGLKPLTAETVTETVQSSVDPLFGTNLAHTGELADLFES